MRKKWTELSPRQQALLLTLSCTQISLALTAWIDLARRPADQIAGRKSAWAAVIAINFVGPALYFLRGRRRP